jgi:putative signal transducing protein
VHEVLQSVTSKEKPKLLAKTQATMEEGWIKIYKSTEEYQAILIKELLEGSGLHPVLMDRKDDEFLIGEAEIYVSGEEAERARKVIEDNQAS